MTGKNQALKPLEYITDSTAHVASNGFEFRMALVEGGNLTVETHHEEAGATMLYEQPDIVSLFNELRHFAEVAGGATKLLRIARSLLKEALRNEARLMAPNEYRRKIHSLAQKIGATPAEIEPMLTSILGELFEEMTKPQRKANTRRKHR